LLYEIKIKADDNSIFAAGKKGAVLRKKNAAPLIVILLLAVNCSRHAPPVEQSAQSEIVVAAAANLTDAFAELGKQFTTRTGIRVVYSFGATVDLAKQIENGAPFDVFAAADVEHIDELDDKKLLSPDTKALYARGRLVLWFPTNARVLHRIEDITGKDMARVAIAKPDVAPYGRATVEALRALNIWNEVEPKVVYGQNVAQAKQFAATGNADAAFVPLALVMKEPAARIIEVDERLHQPINQALGIVQASSKQMAARAFTDFVMGMEGQAIMQRYGYSKAQ